MPTTPRPRPAGSPPPKPSAPSLEARSGFIMQITRPIGIFAASLLVAEFGFVGGGVLSQAHGEVLFWFAGLVVLAVILAVSVLSYVRPGIWRAEEDPLRQGLARVFAQDMFNLIDGIISNSDSEDEQVFAYADFLLTLRKVDEADDASVREFRRRMAQSATFYANGKLPSSMREKIRDAIEVRKSEVLLAE